MKTAIFLLLTAFLLTLPPQATAQSTLMTYGQTGDQDNAETKSALAKEKEVEKGAKALLSTGFRETIVNLNPVRKPAYGADCGSGIYLFYGETCRTREFGAIYAVGTDEDRVLVRYEPPEEEVREDYCPKGTIYFEEKSYFLDLLSQYDQILEGRLMVDDEKKRIKELLEDE